MKKRFRTKLNNAIELTPLLDIIFIILMVVFCSQRMTDSALQKEAVEQYRLAAAERQQAEDLRAEAVSENVLYKDQLETYENFNEELAVVTIYVDYKPSDIRNRNIRVIVNQTEQTGIPVTPESGTQSYAKLKEQLLKLLSEYKGKPVILSVDSSQILYRDEQALKQLVSEISADCPNLFLKASGGGNE